MEDFLKFLLIAGVVVLGIFREANKKNKSKKTQTTRPASPVFSPVEIKPDAKPMPNFREKVQSLGEKKKPEISVAASLANSSAQDQRNKIQAALLEGPESDVQEEFAIRSAEEARKAIIWGEILERKY